MCKYFQIVSLIILFSLPLLKIIISSLILSILFMRVFIDILCTCSYSSHLRRVSTNCSMISAIPTLISLWYIESFHYKLWPFIHYSISVIHVKLLLILFFYPLTLIVIQQNKSYNIMWNYPFAWFSFFFLGAAGEIYFRQFPSFQIYMIRHMSVVG